MNIQLYISKKNFDVQKAERFFKERRIAVQLMDLKKHRLGEREVQAMARAGGLQALIDREDKKVREHPACYYNQDSLLLPAVLEAQVDAAENFAQVYDDNWQYREDFAQSVLEETARQVTAGIAPVERQITLRLAFENGQWWVVPDQALLQIISGVA